MFNNQPSKIIFGFGEDNFRSKIGRAIGYSNPLNGKQSKHVEIDPIDIVGYVGIISLILYFFILFYWIGYPKIGSNSIFIYSMLIYSFIAGHVLINTLLYLPLAIVLFLKENIKFYNIEN